MAGLVGLIGAKRAGKDALAGFLVEDHGFSRVAFADPLKVVALEVNPLVGVAGFRLADAVALEGWDAAKGRPEVRRFLQELGVACRRQLGSGVWVEPAMRRAAELRAGGVPVVVTDVRFENEWRAVRSAGGRLVRVVRPGLVADDGHVSEALAWDESVPVDLRLVNDGALEDWRGAAEFVAGYVM